MIYSYSLFGFEGSVVEVEVDLRRGIPSVDIVGLADGAVKESRERMKAAIKNSGFEFPSERVLISLCPADVRKEGASFDLSLALAVLAQKDDYPRSQDAKVLVIGELGLGGNVRPVRGIYAALSTALSSGIRYAIIPKGSETAIPEGIHVTYVEDLREAYDALVRFDEAESLGTEFEESVAKKSTEMKVEFNELDYEETLDSIEGHNGLKSAMATAVAGGHHILAWGGPGCGKTIVFQHMPELMPKLLPEEQQTTTRIYSLAGLSRPGEGFKTERPFRMPHQTISIEGLFGGGTSCRPGEIELAHNGVLFLDNVAEFRSSCLQILRVPLESRSITLSRGGRNTVYPAKFQLAITTDPCPCGNYGCPDKICLCSAKAVEMYWRKFCNPLLDRIVIRFNAERDEVTGGDYSLENLRAGIKRAWERQLKRQGKLNQNLTLEEFSRFITVPESVLSKLNELSFSLRAATNILKLARTIADMNDIEESPVITERHLELALQLHDSIPGIVNEIF